MTVPYLIFEHKQFSTTVDVNLSDWHVYEYEPEDKELSPYIKLEVHLYDPELNNKKYVGFIEGTHFNVEAMSDYNSPIEEFFVKNGAKDVFKKFYIKSGYLKQEYAGLSQNVFLIQNLWVAENMRNKGYGKEILTLLEKSLYKLFQKDMALIIVNPKNNETFENENIHSFAFKKICKYFEKNGFEKKTHSILYKKTE